MSEVGCQRTEDGRQLSEVGRRTSDVGCLWSGAKTKDGWDD